jgi:hypothetical protein
MHNLVVILFIHFNAANSNKLKISEAELKEDKFLIGCHATNGPTLKTLNSQELK